MNLMIRRRALTDKDTIIAISAEESPQLMAHIYELGWAKNASYLTAKEAEKITNEQFALGFPKVEYSHFPWAESFDGFRYFTSITIVPDQMFYNGPCKSVIFPPTITKLDSSTLRMTTACSNKIVSFPNLEYINNWNFNGSNAIVFIGNKIKNINHGYNFGGSKAVIINAETPPNINTTDWGNLPKFYVPDSSIESYRTKFPMYDINPISECPYTDNIYHII